MRRADEKPTFDDELREQFGHWPILRWCFRGPQKRFEVAALIALCLGALGSIALLAVLMMSVSQSKRSGKVVPLYEAASLMDAEPILRKYLEANDWRDLLSMVRFEKKLEPLMADWYQLHPYRRPESYEILEKRYGQTAESKARPEAADWLYMFKVKTFNPDRLRMITAVQAPDGSYKIDWETSEGYEAMPLKAFIEERPTEEILMRLKVGLGHYYNFSFDDDAKWKSFGFVDPSGQYAVYGYAERGSHNERMLSEFLSLEPFVPVMVGLRFPEDPADDGVLITRVIQKDWLRQSKPL